MGYVQAPQQRAVGTGLTVSRNRRVVGLGCPDRSLGLAPLALIPVGARIVSTLFGGPSPLKAKDKDRMDRWLTTGDRAAVEAVASCTPGPHTGVDAGTPCWTTKAREYARALLAANPSSAPRALPASVTQIPAIPSGAMPVLTAASSTPIPATVQTPLGPIAIPAVLQKRTTSRKIAPESTAGVRPPSNSGLTAILQQIATAFPQVAPVISAAVPSAAPVSVTVTSPTAAAPAESSSGGAGFLETYKGPLMLAGLAIGAAIVLPRLLGSGRRRNPARRRSRRRGRR